MRALNIPEMVLNGRQTLTEMGIKKWIEFKVENVIGCKKTALSSYAGLILV